jgi:hypothetical protein
MEAVEPQLLCCRCLGGWLPSSVSYLTPFWRFDAVEGEPSTSSFVDESKNVCFSAPEFKWNFHG